MLSAEQVASYRRDGFLVVPGLVTGDELAELQAASDKVMAEAIEYGRKLDAERGPIQLNDDHGFREWDEIDEFKFLYGRDQAGNRIWRRAEGMWDRDPAFRRVTAHPGILGVVRSLLGPVIVPRHDSMVVKMPGAGSAVPWHRDPPGDYHIARGIDGSIDPILDLYLDPSTVDNGAVWAIPGSHLGVPLEVDLLDFDRPDAVVLEAEPGDLVIHCSGVLHGSPANTGGTLRRTFYLHYGTPTSLQEGWFTDTDEQIAEHSAMLAEWEAVRAGAPVG